MNAMYLVITSIALFVLAYRFYFSFIAAIAGTDHLVGLVLAA